MVNTNTLIILFLSIIIQLCKVLMVFDMCCMECLITPHSSSPVRGNAILLAQSSFLSLLHAKAYLFIWKNKLVESIYVSRGKRHRCTLDSECNLIMRKDSIGRSYLWLFIMIIFLIQICDYLLFQCTLNEGFGVFSHLEDEDKDISVNEGTPFRTRL